jgi:hypothetical protein
MLGEILNHCVGPRPWRCTILYHWCYWTGFDLSPLFSLLR